MTKQRLRALVDRLEKCVAQIEAGGTVCESTQRSNIETIIHTVAEFYGIQPRMMRSKCREQLYCWPRHIAVYFACRHTSLPLQGIGRHFGYTDHGSVIHAERRIRNALDINDRSVREDIDQLSVIIQKKLNERIQQSGNPVSQLPQKTAQTSRLHGRSND